MLTKMELNETCPCGRAGEGHLWATVDGLGKRFQQWYCSAECLQQHSQAAVAALSMKSDAFVERVARDWQTEPPRPEDCPSLWWMWPDGAKRPWTVHASVENRGEVWVRDGRQLWWTAEMGPCRWMRAITPDDIAEARRLLGRVTPDVPPSSDVTPWERYKGGWARYSTTDERAPPAAKAIPADDGTWFWTISSAPLMAWKPTPEEARCSADDRLRARAVKFPDPDPDPAPLRLPKRVIVEGYLYCSACGHVPSSCPCGERADGGAVEG